MDALSTFEDCLDGTSIVHRTTVAEFEETLATALELPAVGTPLPFEGVSLSGTDVETDPDLDAIDAARTGVTPAGLGVAEYGTVTVESTAAAEELISLYVDRHVAVLAASDLVADMPAAFDRLDDEMAATARTRILATGPSSTADMGRLLTGVHGPDETHVIVLEDR